MNAAIQFLIPIAMPLILSAVIIHVLHGSLHATIEEACPEGGTGSRFWARYLSALMVLVPLTASLLAPAEMRAQGYDMWAYAGRCLFVVSFAMTVVLIVLGLTLQRELKRLPPAAPLAREPEIQLPV